MSISRVQGAGNRAAASASNTVTLTSGVTQGNLLVASVAAGNTAATWTTPTGWTLAKGNAGVAQGVSVYYVIVTAAMAGTTSFTFNLNSAYNNDLVLSEWNSTTGWQSNPVDQVAIGSPSSSTTVSSGTTPTTTQAVELWIAGLAYGGAGQTESSLTSGWSFGAEAAGGPTLREVYQIASAIGAASASFTIGTAQNQDGTVVTFMPSPAVSGAIFYASNVAQTAGGLTQSDQMATTSGGTETSVSVTMPSSGTNTYVELASQGGTQTGTG